MAEEVIAPKKRAPRKKAEAAAPVAPVAVEQKPEKPVKKRATRKATAATISAEERHHLIEVAAYYIAERRGFAEGSIECDWLEAEKQIDSMIAEGKFTAI